MNKLKELIDLIKEQKAMLSIDPEDVDPRVRNTFEGQLRNCKEKLLELEEQYKNEVMNSAVVITVTGPEAETFSSIARSAAIALDYKMLLNELTLALRQRNAPEPYDSNTHFMLLDELQKVRLKYNMVRLPMPVVNGYNDGIYGTNIKEAVDLLIKKNYENGLYSAVIRREVGQIALDGEFSGRKIPVFLYNHDGKVDVNFLPNPITVVEINKKMDKEEVFDKIKELKNIINNTKKEGQQ